MKTSTKSEEASLSSNLERKKEPDNWKVEISDP
jgi:hypothetical protein